MNFLTSKIAEFLLKKPVFKYLIEEIRGLENVPKSNFILVSNHQSHLDEICTGAVAVLSKHYNFHFLGQVDRYKGFTQFFLWVLYLLTGTIPLNRNDEKSKKRALEKAIKVLKENKVLILYPEGTRSRTGELLPGKYGVAKIFLKTKVPVLPVAIKGTFELLPPNKAIPKLKRIVKINIGKLLEFKEELKKAENIPEGSPEYKDLLKEITEKIMAEIKKLVEEIQ